MNNRKQARQQRAYDRATKDIANAERSIQYFTNYYPDKTTVIECYTAMKNNAIQQRDNLRKKGFVSSPGIPAWEINS